MGPGGWRETIPGDQQNVGYLHQRMLQSETSILKCNHFSPSYNHNCFFILMLFMLWSSYEKIIVYTNVMRLVLNKINLEVLCQVIYISY